MLAGLLFFSLPAAAKEFKFKTSDGVELHVTVKGKGTPCVYMHGGPGSGAFWLEYFSGDMLEQEFQMIYVDQRGTSRSGGTAEDDYSIDRVTLDFEELREHLGLKKWLTLGHSFGGVLQMAYAQRYPEALQGMLMINCTISLNESIEDMIRFAASELKITDTAPLFDQSKYPLDRVSPLMNQMREQGVFWKFHYQQEQNYHLMDSVMALVPDWNGTFSGKAMSTSDYFKDFKPMAPLVRVPVLFFYGTQDWAIGPEHYKNIHFPKQLRWEFKGGHVPFMEGEAELQKAIQRYKKKYKAVLG